ncbi:hypothetical protein CRE_24838 [Caenorhabditis remanei]|uniref:Uncharacterized protein n=1 Tax=Caenorhabditis remanei TaxID=31234 RepID=E3NJ25_CAERE|nr:hypothetical protein CRE_24838 [Caenorhabditis remanei]
MNSRNSCLLFSIFIAVNLIIHRKLFLENQKFHLELQKTDDINFTSSFLHVDFTGNSQNTCVLPEYDIWHPDIKKVLTAKFPANNCDKSFEPWTQLVNSTWRVVNEEAELCLARCIEGVRASREVTFGKWITPGYVDCEFLEAVCWESGGEEVYGYIHTQIIPKPPTPPLPLHKSPPPNVFFLMIDSLSTGMAKRSLPKFLKYFQSEFNGIQFPYVNRVGENSHPNGVSLWFGKSVESGQKVSGERIDADWNAVDKCHRYIDNETHLFKQFKDHGYTTLLTEDSINQLMDSHPFCKGFLNKPVDHMFRPFTSVYEEYGMDITRQHLKGHLCREIHEAAMEYWEQAMNAYRDRPLFAFTWLIDLAHEYPDGPVRFDDYLTQFFERNREILDDSFIFISGDHGIRVGDHITSEIGSFERNNPFLGISVPKKFRDGPMVEMLRMNSNQLQTHFDTRATLLDILTYQPVTAFTDRNPLSIPNEKGHSLLRKQPEFPRTCGTLPIPNQYCICQVKKTKVKDENLKMRLGQKVLDRVHMELDKLNFTSICRKYELKEVPSLIEYDYSTQWNTYEIEVKTAEPSAVHFQTMITYNPKTHTATVAKVVRMDRYGGTAECTAKKHFITFCNCKDLGVVTNLLNYFYSFVI